MTGLPILAKATDRMKARYLRHLRGLDKENANPLALLVASVDPDSLSLLLQGLYSGERHLARRPVLSISR